MIRAWYEPCVQLAEFFRWFSAGFMALVRGWYGVHGLGTGFVRASWRVREQPVELVIGSWALVPNSWTLVRRLFRGHGLGGSWILVRGCFAVMDLVVRGPWYVDLGPACQTCQTCPDGPLWQRRHWGGRGWGRGCVLGNPSFTMARRTLLIYDKYKYYIWKYWKMAHDVMAATGRLK